MPWRRSLNASTRFSANIKSSDAMSTVVPLCAAETPVSEYVRSFLVDTIHEKYAMGGPMVPAAENFIGAQLVLDLHRLTIDLCRETYGALWRPAAAERHQCGDNLLMTLSKPGQRVLLQTSASGGHASMVPICHRLGLEIVDLPYDYDRFQFDSAGLSAKLAQEHVDSC